jgi:uncharacterized protein YcfJ
MAPDNPLAQDIIMQANKKNIRRSALKGALRGARMGVPIGLAGMSLAELIRRRVQPTGGETLKEGSVKVASQIADRVLMKVAAITQEEIARGLSGVPGREDITPEEIDQYAQERYNREYQDASAYPWVGAGLGAVTGGVLGGGMGGLPGAAIGVAGGGLAGAGLGQLTRRGSSNYERDVGRQLGGVAQTGRIPSDVSAHYLEAYPAYATGVQEDRLNPEALERAMARAESLRREKAMVGAARGALRGGMQSHGRGEDEMRGAAYGAASDGLMAYEEALRAQRKQRDLHERGYGVLADALQRRQAEMEW